MFKYDVFLKKKLGMIDIIRMPLRYSPRYTILIALVSFLSGVVPTLSLLATSHFINSSIAFFTEGTGKSQIQMSVLGIILCTLYFSLAPLLLEYLNTRLENSLTESYVVSLIGIIGSLKYHYLENESSLDLISRIASQPEKQCVKSYEKILGAFGLMIKIIGIMAVLFFKVPWAAIAIALIAIPTFFIAIKGGKENYEANRESEKYNRRVKYLSEILTGRKSAKERNLFNFSKKVNDTWHEHYEKSRNIKFKASLKWLKGSEIGGVLTSLLISVIILILVFPLEKGLLSLGLFISITNSIMSLIPDLAWQLPEYTKAIAQSKEYLHDFSALLSLEYNHAYLCLPSKEATLVERIEFRNVSFKYPGTERYVLNNLNLVIEKGKHYALVGVNGSGKTTITKLLTGLYEDYEGEILVNGKAINEYSQESLKSMFAVVYQDFARYGLSLKENIEIGNSHLDSSKKLYDVVNESGVVDFLETLSEGVNTSIGKIVKDSTDLSGGQWQRVAIARALVSSASVRILDEPTAALDPVSESQLYENFEQMSSSMTTLLISHRLASTKFANLIYVIEDGCVSEKGSFDELMKQKGSYAKMFTSQRGWYENEIKCEV